jgi:hypothetical protein
MKKNTPAPYIKMGGRKVCGKCGMCGDSYNQMLYKFGHWSNTFSAIEPTDKMCVALYDYDTCHPGENNENNENIEIMDKNGNMEGPGAGVL